MCPLCLKVFSRRRWAQGHVGAHDMGASLLRASHTPGAAEHPVQMEVMRALIDDDTLCGKPLGGYAGRASALLASWMMRDGDPRPCSIFSRMGARDADAVLVFTGQGPEYWHKSRAQEFELRPFGTSQYFTREFANRFAQHLLRAGGVTVCAMRSLASDMRADGCEVTRLLDRSSSSIPNIMRDIIESAALTQLLDVSKGELFAAGELRAITMDSTYKLGMKIIGSTPADKLSWTTIVGTKGAALAVVPGVGEGAQSYGHIIEASIPEGVRSQVEHVGLDSCSAAVLGELRARLPSLKGISQDTQHVSFAVDRAATAQKVRMTKVGLVARSIMSKFDLPDPNLTDTELYSGGPVGDLTPMEEAYRRHIEHSTMPYGEAERVLRAMNPNIPMRSLAGFAQLCAALVRIYPQRMDVKCGKKTLRGTLMHATAPQTFQWLLNNTRYRTTLSAAAELAMSSGTTRNEQLHARLNRQFEKVVHISFRSLAASVKAWLAADTAVSARVLGGRLSKRISRVDMAPVVTSHMHPFTPDAWTTFIGSPVPAWVAGPPPSARKGARRAGPSAVQAEICDEIRAKVMKRKRPSLFDA